MILKQSLTNKVRVSRVSIIVVFLALIRCISEVFRINSYSSTGITFETVKPFLISALITSIASLLMVILSFYSKHRIVIAIAALTIIVLFILKYYYLPQIAV